MTEKTMTTREAASYLDISIATMQRYIRDGLIPATITNTEKWISYEVLIEDVEKLGKRRNEGDPTFKPGPNSKGIKGKALIYFPCSTKWGKKISHILSPEERAIILEWFANLKKITPRQFEKELEEMGNK